MKLTKKGKVMAEDEFNYGVLKQLVKNIFGGSAEERLVSLADSQQACQSMRGCQVDTQEISGLRSEVDALELALGKLIVERERYWHKARLKTIAKRQLQNIKNMQREQWVREARSLSRYFAAAKENDAAIAQGMLRQYLPADRAEVKLEPNMHGRSMGALHTLKHLVMRGKHYLSEVQNGRKTQA